MQVNMCFLRGLLRWLTEQKNPQDAKCTARYNEFRYNKKEFKMSCWHQQQICTCITLFGTLLCHHCLTTMCNCLIPGFVGDINKWQQIFLLSLCTWSMSLGINSTKKWKSEQVGIITMKFKRICIDRFEWYFCHCHCLDILNSLNNFS